VFVPVTAPTAPKDITEKAAGSFAGASRPRTRELMQGLVRHLHSFAVEVGLTEGEWQAGIAALTATGRITDDRRQEFILWSDTLGLSMLVDALAHQLPAGATESTALGPFYVPDSPLREYGASIAEQASGTPAWVYSRVLDALTARRWPARSSTCGRTGTTACTRCRTQRPRGAPPRPLPHP
jgi:hydroxyquinol 1,2-dioxygenase